MPVVIRITRRGCATQSSYSAPAQFPPTGGAASLSAKGWENANIPDYPVTQQGEEWCVPASSEISLFSTTHREISQSILDTQMSTNNTPGEATSGTNAENALQILNKYANPDGYAYYPAQNTTVAEQNADLNYDIGVLHVAPIALIYDGMLPRGNQQPVGRHAIAIVGFQPSTETVEVEDPIYGMNSLSAQQLFAAEQPPENHPE